VHIWEAKTGRLLRVLLPQGTMVSLAWSPDGRVLAVGTGLFKRAVQLWEADTGRLLRALESPVDDFLFALAWSPDGRKLRAWGTAGRCSTWEAAVGKRLHSPPIACQCQRPAFSPDGQRLAGTGDGNRVLVWDADTGKEVSQINAPAPVWRLAWSPDGKRLACTAKDGLRVWDVESRKEVWHSPKAVNRTDAPVWSPDGRSLVFNLDGFEGTEVIDMAGDAEPRRLDDGGDSWMTWSPDGTTIARINGEPWIRLYDAATGKRRLTLTDGRAMYGFAWSPDQQTLAVSERFDAYLVSADTGQVVAELKEATWPVAWSPDGKQLVTRGPDNEVLLRQADGKVRLKLANYQAEVSSLAWSPDSKRLATIAAEDKRVLIWDAAKGQRDRELGPFPAVPESVKWSADGRLVTFNVAEVGWHVWDLEKSQLVNVPKQWKVFWFDLTPDGRSALVAPNDKEVYRLRDLASGKDGARLPYTHGMYQAHPTWSPDGRQLVVSISFGIELWRSDLSKRLRKMRLEGGASQVAVSRDGKRLAAQTGEWLFVWDTDTGRLRGLMVLGRRNNALTIAPDGHYTGNENVDSGIVMV
ncbi:MAG: WD40 repeat domain-containing protein, partial [Gemmataceae bacterium]